MCSGVLLAPNLVLTVRYRIADVTPGPVLCGKSPLGPEISAHYVTISNEVVLREESGWARVSVLFAPATGRDAYGFDIALLLIEQNMSAAMATPAVPNLDQKVKVIRKRRGG